MQKDPKDFAFASDLAQRLAVYETHDLLLHANPQLQREIAGKEPEEFLKHADKEIQYEMVKKKPGLFDSASDSVKSDLAAETPSLLSRIKEENQWNLALNHPTTHLQHANTAVQAAILEEHPEFFEHASDDAQIRVASEWPKLLANARERVQKKLAANPTGEYLRFVSDTIQKEVLKPETLQYASPAVQRDISTTTPASFLAYAEEDLQRELADLNPEEYLQYASDQIQKEIIEANPALFQFASQPIKDNTTLAKLAEDFDIISKDGMKLEQYPLYQHNPVFTKAAIAQNPNAIKFIKGPAARASAALYLRKQ